VRSAKREEQEQPGASRETAVAEKEKLSPFITIGGMTGEQEQKDAGKKLRQTDKTES